MRLLPYDNSIVYEDDTISVRGFSGGALRTNVAGTVFFFMAAGFMTVNNYRVWTGMYGTYSAREFRTVANSSCRALIVTAKHFKGVFTLGGPIEREGRLRYIDGCTDTGLIAPFVCGDPCLNYLHFPKGVRQTPHTHPSPRVCVVYDGNGVCHTADDKIPMFAGCMFLIPPGFLHSFETTGSPMRVVAFHPDSEVGPTDAVHQMRAATVV